MILVTGANGYVGRHLAHQIGKGDLMLTDIQEEFLYGGRERYNYISADLRDLDSLEKLFRGKRYEAVIHLAALKSVTESLVNPVGYRESNVIATKNLFEFAVLSGVKSFIFASSAAVYGPQLEIQVAEDSILNPQSPYGLNKWECEKLIKDSSFKSSTRSVSLRFFNIAGSLNSSLMDRGGGNVFPIFIDAIRAKQTLRIFGNTFNTPDGSAVRDYIHVLDVANGILKALDSLSDGKIISPAINLGSGTGTSVLTLVNELSAALKSEVNLAIEDARIGEIDAVVADITKARSELGFIPTRSIEEIIDSLVGQ